ncbi:hypothetical protein I1738_003124, partial [Listeria monocytogenes]|nr:hypothetical protein [Listeria monocytogenes]
MKKILLGGIIVCFGVLMIGCGSTTDSETTTKDNEDEQKYSKPESKKDENY